MGTWTLRERKLPTDPPAFLGLLLYIGAEGSGARRLRVLSGFSFLLTCLTQVKGADITLPPAGPPLKTLSPGGHQRVLEEWNPEHVRHPTLLALRSNSKPWHTQRLA